MYLVPIVLILSSLLHGANENVDKYLFPATSRPFTLQAYFYMHKQNVNFHSAELLGG